MCYFLRAFIVTFGYDQSTVCNNGKNQDDAIVKFFGANGETHNMKKRKLSNSFQYLPAPSSVFYY